MSLRMKKRLVKRLLGEIRRRIKNEEFRMEAYPCRIEFFTLGLIFYIVSLEIFGGNNGKLGCFFGFTFWDSKTR